MPLAFRVSMPLALSIRLPAPGPRADAALVVEVARLLPLRPKAFRDDPGTA